MKHEDCLQRRKWEILFDAQTRELAALRRIMRQHLVHWGLESIAEAAQLCVSELVANVIEHVGIGAPTNLAVFMNGTNLRLEVRDFEGEKNPVVIPASADDESGRGLVLVDALAERWGVFLTMAGKTTWCELGTTLETMHGHIQDHRVVRACSALGVYTTESSRPGGESNLSIAQEVEAAVGLIVDLLHWVRAHGLDPENELDRARARYEASPLECV